MFILTLLVILPMMCFKLPHSWYFSSLLWTEDDMMATVWDRNARRLAEAKLHIEGLPLRNERKSNTGAKFSAGNASIVIGVVSVRRESQQIETGYLTQVMSGVTRMINISSKFLDVDVFICDTFAGSGMHKEPKWLSSRFKMHQRFPNGNRSYIDISPFVKEKQDYAYCLEKASEYRAKYTILLEDDAVPFENMLSVIGDVLNGTFNHRQVGEQSRKTVTAYFTSKQLLSSSFEERDRLGFLKLYYPERWQGFSVEYQSILELAGWGILSGCVTVTISLKYTRDVRRPFTLGALYGVIIALVVGRPHLIQYRRISNQLYTMRPAPDCCTQGHLYTQQSSDIFLRELQKHLYLYPDSSLPKDLFLDNTAVEFKLKNYVIEPNLIKHVGFVSTLKGPSIRPADFW